MVHSLLLWALEDAFSKEELPLQCVDHTLEQQQHQQFVEPGRPAAEQLVLATPAATVADISIAPIHLDELDGIVSSPGAARYRIYSEDEDEEGEGEEEDE